LRFDHKPTEHPTIDKVSLEGSFRLELDPWLLQYFRFDNCQPSSDASKTPGGNFCVTGDYRISTASQLAYQTNAFAVFSEFVEAGLDDVIGESQGVLRMSLKPDGLHKNITGPSTNFRSTKSFT
jgi:hypothetical protein